MITAEHHITTATTQNGSNSSPNLNNEPYNIQPKLNLQLALNIFCKKDRNSNTAIKGEMETCRGRTRTLCCRDECARLPPGRCSCNCTNILIRKTTPYK